MILSDFMIQNDPKYIKIDHDDRKQNTVQYYLYRSLYVNKICYKLDHDYRNQSKYYTYDLMIKM